MRQALARLIIAAGVIGTLPLRASAQFVGTQNITAASADCTTAASCAVFDVGSAPGFTVVISNVWSATLQLECSADVANAQWAGPQWVNVATATNVTSTTANGTFSIANAGYEKCRVRASAYTSGTARVTGVRAFATARLFSPSLPTLYLDTLCLDQTNRDTCLARAAAGKLVLTGTTPMILIGGSTSSFPAFKQNSTGVDVKLADDSAFTTLTASGFRLSSNASTIAVVGSGSVTGTWRTSQDTNGRLALTSDNGQNNTSAYWPLTTLQGTFNPGSGSGSWAGLEVRPTINGTSSGTAYGVVVASLTNTLSGGTIRLLSLGTTTTDAITGYTEKFAVDLSGVPAKVSGLTTTALGVPVIMASYETTGNTGGVSNAINFTPAATSSTYELTGVVNVTAWTTPASFTVTTSYKDASGNARTDTALVIRGSTGASAAAVTAIDRWYFHFPAIDVDNSATAITMSTTGTFTGSPVYNFQGTLRRLR